jgi:hypothetical protein
MLKTIAQKIKPASKQQDNNMPNKSVKRHTQTLIQAAVDAPLTPLHVFDSALDYPILQLAVKRLNEQGLRSNEDMPIYLIVGKSFLDLADDDYCVKSTRVYEKTAQQDGIIGSITIDNNVLIILSDRLWEADELLIPDDRAYLIAIRDEELIAGLVVTLTPLSWPIDSNAPKHVLN